MTTLAGQIRAAINAHGRIALAATQGKWSVDNEQYAEYITADDLYGTMVVSGGRWGGEASVFNETADAIHIAANDPPHALAVTTGHRAILDLHGRSHLPNGVPTDDCEACENVSWPCETVLALARIYRIDLSVATET